jgi:hypothetical protein
MYAYISNTNAFSTMMNCYEKGREKNEIFYDNQLLISLGKLISLQIHFY